MINVDLGVRIESLADSPPAAPVVKTKPLDLSDPLAPTADPLTQPLEDPLTPTEDPLTQPLEDPPTPDVPPTAFEVDPATTWRESSRFHNLAADTFGLRHL